MKKYIIIDEEGYTWCVDKGIATDKYGNTIRNFGYWGHKKFEVYEGDFNKRIKRMNYLHALFLFSLMRLSGIRGNSLLNFDSVKRG